MYVQCTVCSADLGTEYDIINNHVYYKGERIKVAEKPSLQCLEPEVTKNCIVTFAYRSNQ
jgi:hypothetical protein